MNGLLTVYSSGCTAFGHPARPFRTAPRQATGGTFEGADGPQMREHGWKALLDKLGNELEQD